MTLFPVKVLLFLAACLVILFTVANSKWYDHIAHLRSNRMRWRRQNEAMDERIREIERETGVPSDAWYLGVWYSAILATILMMLCWFLPSKLM
jgi:uncharacterized membrane protein